jgi:Flp pilus assembly protein TadG
MVEFAIAAGVFFIPLFFALFEFGLAFWSKNAAAADAREAARYAIVRGSTSSNVATVDSVRKFVKQRTSLRTLGPDSVRVYATWPTNNNAGSMVHVSIAQPVPRRGIFIKAHTDSVSSKMVILF